MASHWTDTPRAPSSRSMLDEIRAHELRLLAQLELEASRPTPPPPEKTAESTGISADPRKSPRPPLAHAGGTSYLPVEYHLPDEPRSGGAHADGPRRRGIQ